MLEGSDRKKVIESLHSGNSGGHFASVNTVNRIRTAGYWWPYMNRDVKNFVDLCDQCQRTGAPSFRNHWPLTPIIPLVGLSYRASGGLLAGEPGGRAGGLVHYALYEPGGVL
jgi:hypothetical protein